MMTSFQLNGLFFCFPSLYVIFAVAGSAPEESTGMTWTFRLMAAACGGAAGLFALYFAEPKSRREAVYRFAAGCVVAFVMTGTTLHLMHITINTDTILAGGLVWGSVAWWTLSGLVEWGKAGGPLAYIAKLIEGRQAQNMQDKPKP